MSAVLLSITATIEVLRAAVIIIEAGVAKTQSDSKQYYFYDRPSGFYNPKIQLFLLCFTRTPYLVSRFSLWDDGIGSC